jgi:preprotein translocase subunit SecG
MYPFFVALHVCLCLFLVTIVLLQPGKGGDVGAAFGGGSSSSLFGPRGPAGLLQRATTVVAVLFMGTSVTLALYSNRAVLSDANVEDELQRLQQEEQDRGEVAPSPIEEPTLPDEAAHPRSKR